MLPANSDLTTTNADHSQYELNGFQLQLEDETIRR